MAGHEPPPRLCWTSPSLRKGAASAAYAIKVRLNDIRYAGGWSTKSTVMESKYVDFIHHEADEGRPPVLRLLEERLPYIGASVRSFSRRPEAYIHKNWSATAILPTKHLDNIRGSAS